MKICPGALPLQDQATPRGSISNRLDNANHRYGNGQNDLLTDLKRQVDTGVPDTVIDDLPPSTGFTSNTCTNSWAETAAPSPAPAKTAAANRIHMATS